MRKAEPAVSWILGKLSPYPLPTPLAGLLNTLVVKGLAYRKYLKNFFLKRKQTTTKKF
jgi:hypothetical protein